MAGPGSDRPYGSFQQLGSLLRSSCNKDHSMLWSILGPFFAVPGISCGPLQESEVCALVFWVGAVVFEAVHKDFEFGAHTTLGGLWDLVATQPGACNRT